MTMVGQSQQRKMSYQGEKKQSVGQKIGHGKAEDGAGKCTEVLQGRELLDEGTGQDKWHDRGW